MRHAFVKRAQQLCLCMQCNDVVMYCHSDALFLFHLHTQLYVMLLRHCFTVNELCAKS